MGGRRKRGLADLIGEVGTAPHEPEEERPGSGAATAAARERTRKGTSENRPRGGGEAAVRPNHRPSHEVAPARLLPKYLALQRKEARLRGDQVDALASLARRMNRDKVERGGERITENTLIRVAVDWLLSRDVPMGTSSEEEIRRGLGVPDHRN